MNYLYAAAFRQFGVFTIKNVYAPYREGGVKTSSGWLGRTFKVDDQGQLIERIWTDNKPEWVPAAGDIIVWDKEKGESGESYTIDASEAMKNKHFWATYKKVFNVELTTPEEVTIVTKKGDVTGTEWAIRGLGSFKIKTLLESDMNFDVPQDGDKPAFDWEDEHYKKIEGCTYKMKVTGKMLDTKYKIKLLATLDDNTATADDTDGFVEEEPPF